MPIKQLLKEGFWALTGHGSLLLGVLFSIKILSQDMGPSLYGEFVLGSSIAQLFQTFFFGSKFDGIIRFAAVETGFEQRASYAKIVNKVLVDATKLCLSFGFFVTLVVYIKFGKDWSLLVLAAVIYSVTSGVSTALGGFVNALRERRILAINQGTETWIKVFLAFGLIQISESKAVVALLGYALACSVSVIGLSIWLGRKFKSNIRFSGFEVGSDEVIRNYSKGFALSGIFLWFQNYADRWALKYFSSLSEVGIYSVAFAFGYSPLVAIVNISMQIAVPIVYKDAGKTPDFSSRHKILRSVDLLGLFVFSISVVLAMVALYFKRLVIEVFLGEDYRDAANLIPMLLLAGGLFAVGEAKAIFLNAIFKNKLQILPKLSLAMFGVGLTGILTFFYGSAGAAGAVLTVSLVYAFWMSRIAYLECQS
jgi:O-antigen/teichoic acid export membrane protein